MIYLKTIWDRLNYVKCYVEQFVSNLVKLANLDALVSNNIILMNQLKTKLR